MGMGGCPMMGPLVPTVMLLVISFFVLVVSRKNDTQGLKVFGCVLAVLLWILAAFALVRGVMGGSPMMCKMQGMGAKMGGPGMMGQQTPMSMDKR